MFPDILPTAKSIFFTAIDAITPSIWRGGIIKRSVSLALMSVSIVCSAMSPLYIAIPVAIVIVVLLGLDFYRNRKRIDPPQIPTPRETLDEEIVTEEVIFPRGTFAFNRSQGNSLHPRASLQDAQMILRAMQAPATYRLPQREPVIEDRFNMFQPRVTIGREIPFDAPIVFRRTIVRRHRVRENMPMLAIEAPKEPLWLRFALAFSSAEDKVNGLLADALAGNVLMIKNMVRRAHEPETPADQDEPPSEP